MIRALFGRPPRSSPEANRGGILDPRPLEALLTSTVDVRRIEEHVAAGRLHAVSVTATHVGSGRINPRGATASVVAPDEPASERAFIGPVFLLGKVLNALSLDRVRRRCRAARAGQPPAGRRRAPVRSGLHGADQWRSRSWRDVPEADFLSYVLFDGDFARLLIELGREDAHANHDQIVRFFDAALMSPVEDRQPLSGAR
jgi:hypothetical protein